MRRDGQMEERGRGEALRPEALREAAAEQLLEGTLQNLDLRNEGGGH